MCSEMTSCILMQPLSVCGWYLRLKRSGCCPMAIQYRTYLEKYQGKTGGGRPMVSFSTWRPQPGAKAASQGDDTSGEHCESFRHSLDAVCTRI